MSGLAYAMFGCENNEKRRISFHLRVIFCYGSSFEQGGLDHAGRRISFHLRVIFCYGSSFEQGGLDHAGYGRDYFFCRIFG